MSRAPSSSSIRPVTYRNPRNPDSPVEVLALAELRRKAPAGYLVHPQRPAFHQVHVLTRGHCELEVDFERVALNRRTVAWVRPGQVQRFDLHDGVDGWLLMFTADVLESDLFDEPVGPRVDLGNAGEDVAWLLERLRRASEEEAYDERHPLLRHLLHALLLVLHRRGRTSIARCPAPVRSVFAIFRKEVERRFAKTRRVEDYERLIGYSSKTLTRAARAATGLSAKQYIDQRVLLESRRLLAHTTLSAGEIAQRVGFSELTNFIKFFRRESGESPTRFRQRGSSASPSDLLRPRQRSGGK
jgi:AraC-like DNA-binding protein